MKTEFKGAKDNDARSSWRSRVWLIIRWLLVTQLSALVTIAAVVLAEDGFQGERSVTRSLDIIMDFNRMISVTDVGKPGNIVLSPDEKGSASDVKSYCVRANYKGNAKLRILSSHTSIGSFYLVRKDKDGDDEIPILLYLADAEGEKGTEQVFPNLGYSITPADAKASCDKATTNLEISVNFEGKKSGRYETTLKLVFSAT